MFVQVSQLARSFKKKNTKSMNFKIVQRKLRLHLIDPSAAFGNGLSAAMTLLKSRTTLSPDNAHPGFLISIIPPSSFP